MLVDDLKKRMMAAMKASRGASGEGFDRATVEKELWRTALGEITMTAHTTGVEPSDELVISVLKKLVKSAEETLKMTADAAQRLPVEFELEQLRTVLPQGPSEQAVRDALAAVAPQLLAAKNDGQAVGVAMKHLKSVGLTVDGKTASSVVAAIRAGQGTPAS